MKPRKPTDKVRASRDGHEFHENWAARKSLELLLDTADLCGIAVEGMSPTDQADASQDAIEIADLTLYYGGAPSFEAARETVIVQLKYSHSALGEPFRAAETKKTIKKFASAFSDHTNRFGVRAVDKRLSFELLTNRPIDPGFIDAIAAIAQDREVTGDTRNQASQFTEASGLSGRELRRFASRIRLTGLAGSLTHNKRELSRVIADWSGAPDVNARAALGGLRDLVRAKAGLEGSEKNLIDQTDVAAALGLQSADDLLPCPAAFPEVGPVVPREGLDAVAASVVNLSKPLLVHADGGVGKTVFLQSLAETLSAKHETELFDCFGGGAYRSPEDGRHLPRRGMVHIVNRLACRGLCDPVLPLTTNADDLLRAFRRRLEQAASTLRRVDRDSRLILFLDAIDNAAERARDTGEPSFPRLLLESVWHSGEIPGVKLVVSCRTHRREIAKGDVPCEEFVLRPFSEKETASYLADRVPDLTEGEVAVGFSRSNGNARILEYLVHSDRVILNATEITHAIQLDDLLRERIQKALEAARRRGYSESELRPFLAGLSVLPAPVPTAEYADAHGIDQGVVISFAADLAPLLELTPHGLMFRDEPTETLIRDNYAADDTTLRRLAANLRSKQGSSVYAAAALPGLLQRLGDGALLFELAFEERFPASITSKVGRERIRYARVKAATEYAVRSSDFDRLVHFLVELSSIAVVEERGTNYITDHPDLVVASKDIDASRRLFETRTNWPGTRHARLCIASTLSGDLNDGFRYARNANEWINHFYRQDEDYRRDKYGPGRMDAAAIAFCLAAKGRARAAARYLGSWTDWFAFGVTEITLGLLGQAERSGAITSEQTNEVTSALSGVAPLASAIASLESDRATRERLLRRLATACNNPKKPIEVSDNYDREPRYRIQEGLVKAAAVAVSYRHYSYARRILAVVRDARPHLWSLSERFLNNEAVWFVIRTALRCVSERLALTEDMLLPQELVDLAVHAPNGIADSDYHKALGDALQQQAKTRHEEKADGTALSYESRQEAERFIGRRLRPLAELTHAMISVFAQRHGEADAAFLELVNKWTTLRMRGEEYSDVGHPNTFFDPLGRQCIQFALWVRDDLGVAAVDAFAAIASAEATTPVQALIALTGILSKRPPLQEMAGRIAKTSSGLIEREDEVVHRGGLFAALGRAILPASIDEASAYFRAGLEQMDAIGSGDYQFINELLNFCETLKADELEVPDFHTLANICELNISDSEKFPWIAFGRALARVSGPRALARLGRWADRGKASLDYTLLPYLLALVDQGKMSPGIALGLLRLSIPVEYHDCGTEQLARLLASKDMARPAEMIAELIRQFVESHPPVYMPSTTATLGTIATQHLSADSELPKYLRRAAPKFAALREEENQTRNYSSYHTGTNLDREARRQQSQTEVERIAASTDPKSEESLSTSVDVVRDLDWGHDLKRELLHRVRSRVQYGERGQYLRAVASVHALDIYTKLHELKECKDAWSGSSSGLDLVFREAGLRLVRANADDFVDFDYLSRFRLKELSDISGLSVTELTLELISAFAGSEVRLSPSVWLGLATVASENTSGAPGRDAIKRLLNSNAAQLATTVLDGAWKPGLYPTHDVADAAAGLVWLKLGSPLAAERWLAAHSVRVLARLSEWRVLDELMRRYDSVDARPFQASELRFFFLHARLWLLIAIARAAIDHPLEVARHADKLVAIALDESAPHILIRHFAAQAALVCDQESAVRLQPAIRKRLKAVSKSPFRSIKTKEFPRDSFYGDRPDSIPEPENEFHLEYDFDKHEVGRVSEMFGQRRWKLRDDITTWVRAIDPTIHGMYDSDGRERPYRFRHVHGSDHYHSYGYQLGWHALYARVDEYLRTYPIVQRPYDEGDTWNEWLSRTLPTRSDGLWLSDGVDLPPVDAQVNLTESGEPSRAITGSEAKLFALLHTDSPGFAGFVVAGDWTSNDGISITISSALAPENHAERLALELSVEDPFHAWIPDAEDEDGATYHLGEDDRPFEPWIVWGGGEAHLDETDPLGVREANARHQLSAKITSQAGLRSIDPFGRTWVDASGEVIAVSEAWRRGTKHDQGDDVGQRRLVCSPQLIQNIFGKGNVELVFLIRLRRYVESSAGRDSEFWHTLATVRMDKRMKPHIYIGMANQLHVSSH